MPTIWEIGDPSGGPQQFRGTALTTPDSDEVVLAVDAPELRAQFPQVHPGPLAAYAGATDKRLVLSFERDGPSEHRHRLTVKAFAIQGPVPELEIDLNGHTGRFFPTVRRTDRKDVLGVSAIAGWVELVVPIEPHWLRAGENRLALTTTAAEPVESLGAAHPELPVFWGSALAYAAITLDDLADADVDAATGEPWPVSLRPTPLYVEGEDGPAELVDVIVTVPAGRTNGSVALELGPDRFEATLDLGGHDFGHARVRLQVPERDGPCPARVTVVLDGQTQITRTTFRPARKWTLHLLPHVHLDLGYTDYQAKVTEIHTRNVDRVLDIVDARPDYAYSIDGSYVVDQYLRSRSPRAIDRFRRAVLAGQISVNAFHSLFLTGLISLEECFRAGRHSAELRRDLGLPIDYANLTDVPSYSGAMPTVLAAMGIDAFLGVQNHGRAANDDSDELHLASPFRWRGPDGAEVLTYFADCYAQLRYFCGYPVSVPGAAQSFSRFVSRFERDDYLPADLPIVGIYSDNEDLADGEADFVERWSQTYAYPKLRFSTVSDYFAAVRPLQAELPVVRGDGGSYWEDGVGAGAAVIAGYRRAQVGLADAEAIGSLVAVHDPAVRPSLQDLDTGWDALLVGCEHTWTWIHAQHHPHGEQSVDQLAWKAHQVATAERVAVDETRRSLSQLGELVTTDGPTLLVVNTLSWERDVEVEVELPADRAVAEDPDLVLVEPLGPVDGPERVRLTVRSVPALGYRALPLAPQVAADVAVAPASEPVDDAALALDTGRYRLRVERGRVTSLWWKAGARELLDPDAPYALGEVVYVEGGAAPDGTTPKEARTRLFDADPWLPEPDLVLETARMEVASLQRRAHATVLRLTGRAPSLPRIEVELRFRTSDDRVDVRVDLDKQEVRAKESVYIAFPFAVPDATARYDRQVGWVDPTVDHLPGAGNEWFTSLFGVGLANRDLAVHWTSLDAPLFALGDIVRGRWPTSARVGDGTLLSWVMNNYWWTNFPPVQGGHLRLRYAFRPAESWEVTAATRFGREARTGGATGVVGWMDKMDTAPRPLSAVADSLLEVAVPDNVLASVVAGRVGTGCVVRLQEIAGEPAEVTVNHPGGADAPATLVTALEDPIEPLAADADGALRLRLGAHEIRSLRLDAANAAGRP